MRRWIIPVLALLALLALAASACDLTGDPPRSGSSDDSDAPPVARTPAITITPPPEDPCGQPQQPGPSQISLEVDGVSRSYQVYVPTTYDPGRRAAILLNFHGAGGSGEEQAAYSGVFSVADLGGFIVASPDADPATRTWDLSGGEADLNFVIAVIADVNRRLCVDVGRLFAMGFSDGASFSNELACEGFRFTAIAIVSGGGSAQNCRPAKEMDVIIFHGIDDPILPFNGIQPDIWARDWARLNNCDDIPVVEEIAMAIEITRYVGCPDLGNVVFYQVNGGGHTWPGSDEILGPDVGATTHMVQGTLEIARFFGLVD
ncbi:MAG: hypothetical protein WEB00_08795 [Dehalococcoidia bacterium]